MARKKVEPIADNEQVMTDQPAPEEQKAAAPPPASEERRASRQYSEDILTLSDQERGFTPEDTEDVKWNYLRGATHRHLILTGVVSGVENADGNNPIIAVDYEGIRILIPGHEMFMDDWPVNQAPPLNFRLRFGRILGATIDFIPSGVDIKNRAAVGSRREALKQRQARYYASGRVKEGIRIACRVIDVSGSRIIVEALGVDTVIPASELTWEWFADVNNLFATGDIIVAKVMNVQRDPDTGFYQVRLSAKKAVENPDLANLRKLVPGSNYFGVVTNVQDRLIYLRLQAGVNAKTKTYRTKELPCKLDTVSFLVRSVDEDVGAAFGVITRIIKRHNRLR